MHLQRPTSRPEDTGACGVCEVTGEWRSASSKTTTWTEISQYNTVETVQTRAYHLLALGNPVEVIGGGYGETLPPTPPYPSQRRRWNGIEEIFVNVGTGRVEGQATHPQIDAS